MLLVVRKLWHVVATKLGLLCREVCKCSMFFSLINHNGLVCFITCSYIALQFTDTLHWTFPLLIRYLLVAYISYLCCVCNIKTDMFQATMLDDRGKYSYAMLCVYNECDDVWWQSCTTTHPRTVTPGVSKREFPSRLHKKKVPALEFPPVQWLFGVYGFLPYTCRSFGLAVDMWDV